MYILDEYKEEKGLSICFCMLKISGETEKLLNDLQREISESGHKVRQSYVYGDQTVNASDFSYFRKDHFTKVEKSICPYPAHEALALAVGMIQKEAEYIKERDLEEKWKCLLLILGEEAALRDPINKGGSYQVVKNWARTEKNPFTVRILS